MSLTKVSYSMVSGAPVNVFDFLTAAQIADVQAGTLGIDCAAAIQSAFTKAGNNGYVFFPTGNYKVATTITYSCSFGGDQGMGATGPGSGVWYGTYITFTGSGNAFQASAQLYGIVIEKIGIRILGAGVNGIDIRYGGNDCLYQKLSLEAVTGSAPNAASAIYLRGQNPTTSLANFHQHANHFDTIIVVGAFTTGLRLGNDLADGQANSNYVSHFTDYLDTTASTYSIMFNGTGCCLAHMQCYNPLYLYGECSFNAAVGCYFEMAGAAVELHADVGQRQCLTLVGCAGLGSASKVNDPIDPGGSRWSAVGEYTRMNSIQTAELNEMVVNAGVTIEQPNVAYVKFSPQQVATVPSSRLYVSSSDGVLYFKDAGGTLSGVAITGTAGQFSCSASTLYSNQTVTISGTFGGTGSITGYVDPTTYYIIATNGTTTFTLSATVGGGAITTTAGTPTGLTYTFGGVSHALY